MMMRSALFWDITRCLVVIVYRRFGTTSVNNYHTTHRNIPEERRSNVVLCSDFGRLFWRPHEACGPRCTSLICMNNLWLTFKRNVEHETITMASLDFSTTIKDTVNFGIFPSPVI
jgi:hypothetical protein